VEALFGAQGLQRPQNEIPQYAFYSAEALFGAQGLQRPLNESPQLTIFSRIRVNLAYVINLTNSGHDSWVLSVAPHPSGTCFASGGSDAKVSLGAVHFYSCLVGGRESERASPGLTKFLFILYNFFGTP
jgi:hypothetical protein